MTDGNDAFGLVLCVCGHEAVWHAGDAGPCAVLGCDCHAMTVRPEMSAGAPTSELNLDATYSVVFDEHAERLTTGILTMLTKHQSLQVLSGKPPFPLALQCLNALACGAAAVLGGADDPRLLQFFGDMIKQHLQVIREDEDEPEPC